MLYSRHIVILSLFFLNSFMFTLLPISLRWWTLLPRLDTLDCGMSCLLTISIQWNILLKLLGIREIPIVMTYFSTTRTCHKLIWYMCLIILGYGVIWWTIPIRWSPHLGLFPKSRGIYLRLKFVLGLNFALGPPLVAKVMIDWFLFG